MERTLWDQLFCPQLRGCPLLKSTALLWERGPDVCPLLGGCPFFQRVLYRKFHCTVEPLNVDTLKLLYI